MLARRTPGSESKSGLMSLPPLDSRDDSRDWPVAGIEKRSPPPPSTGVAGLFDAGPPTRPGAEVRSGTGSSCGSDPFSATESIIAESRQNESRAPFDDRRSEIDTRVLPSGIVPCPALSLESRGGRTSLAGDPV